jgi:hypothetical protein
MTVAEGTHSTATTHEYAALIIDNLGHQAWANANYYATEPITCADGSAGEVDTSWSAYGPATSYKLGKGLSKASVTASLPGELDVSNSCDGSSSSTTETWQFALTVKTTTIEARQSSRTVIYNTDKTKTITTMTYLEYWATGTITFQGATSSVDPNGGDMYHQVVKVTTK